MDRGFFMRGEIDVSGIDSRNPPFRFSLDAEGIIIHLVPRIFNDHINHLPLPRLEKAGGGNPGKHVGRLRLPRRSVLGKADPRERDQDKNDQAN